LTGTIIAFRPSISYAELPLLNSRSGLSHYSVTFLYHYYKFAIAARRQFPLLAANLHVNFNPNIKKLRGIIEFPVGEEP
jgi:hypothetical protein